jgi:hypothetical protein
VGLVKIDFHHGKGIVGGLRRVSFQIRTVSKLYDIVTKSTLWLLGVAYKSSFPVLLCGMCSL